MAVFDKTGSWQCPLVTRPSLSSRFSRPKPRFTFQARGTVQSFAGESPREHNFLVELQPAVFSDRETDVLSLRTIRRRKDGDAKASNSGTKFSLRACMHVSERDKLNKQNVMVILFSKKDIDCSLKEKTKFRTVSLRGWTRGNSASVEGLWTRLNQAAQSYAERLHAKSIPEKPVSVVVPCGSLPSMKASIGTALSTSNGTSNGPSNGGSHDQPVVPIEDRVLRSAVSPRLSQAGGRCVAPLENALIENRDDERRRPPTGKYTRMGGLSRELVGPPSDAGTPLYLSKTQRMRVRPGKKLPPSFNGTGSAKRRSSEVIREMASQREPDNIIKKQRKILHGDEHSASNDSASFLSVVRATEFDRSAKEGQEAERPASLSSAIIDRDSVTENAQRLPATHARALRSNCRALGTSSLTKGIANLGNTCYLGSALQLFMHNESFMLDVEYKLQKTNQAPFSKALLGLYNARDSAEAHLYPQMVRDAISSHFPEFGTGLQQDAHEFLTRCFSVLEEELGANVLESPVSRNFSIVLESKYECTLCGKMTTPRRELFHDLSLDIPSVNDAPQAEGIMMPVVDKENLTSSSCGLHGTVASQSSVHSSPVEKAISLEKLIATYFRSYEVELTCESPSCCGTRARKHTRTVLRPRVLVLHLKRFRAEMTPDNVFTLVKVSDRIDLPSTIDLAGFEACKSGLGPSVFVTERSRKIRDHDNGCDGSLGHCLCTERISTVPGRVRLKPAHPPKLCRKSGLNSGTKLRDSRVTQYFNSDHSSIDRSMCRCAETGARCPEFPHKHSNYCSADAEHVTGVIQAGCTSPSRVNKPSVGKGVNSKEQEACQSDCRDSPLCSNARQGRQGSCSDSLSDKIDEEFECNQAVFDEMKTDHVRSCMGVSDESAQGALHEAHGNVARALRIVHDRSEATSHDSPSECVRDVLDVIESPDNSFTASEGTRYRLSAVVRHLSSVAEYGHYVCDVRQTDDEWRCFDDSISFSCGREPYKSFDRQQDSYLLFYTLE